MRLSQVLKSLPGEAGCERVRDYVMLVCECDNLNVLDDRGDEHVVIRQLQVFDRNTCLVEPCISGVEGAGFLY